MAQRIPNSFQEAAMECPQRHLDLSRNVLDTNTDAALDALGAAGLLRPVMDLLGERIQATLERWVPTGVEIGFICFTNAGPWQGVLVKSDNAEALAKAWR